MEALFTPLLPLFERERAAQRAFTLAVVVHTAGSTYRKPGALMAITADGDYAGLLSGGCLETDLREHARSVIATGKARSVTYDTGGSDDPLWGLGIGCEGAMRILLLRVGPETGWQPCEHLARALAAHSRTAFALAVESATRAVPAGQVFLPDDSPAAPLGSRTIGAIETLLARATRDGRTAWFELEQPALRVFAVPLALPPRLLLLGGGPDAAPIVDFGARLGWKITVYDHRPAYAQAAHFPGAERVVLARPEELARALELSAYDAAVVMSHHLPSDLAYLRVLAASDLAYLGLLGPVIRREHLLADLGADAARMRQRLHSPVGLALGGRAPESIALSIVAELHAHFHAPAAQASKQPLEPMTA